MAIEIERKFLVRSDDWRHSASGARFRQGYLSTVHERTVRVRVIADTGYLTVKGATLGAARPEFEYVIPVDDAQAMLDRLCLRPLIEKTRYTLEYQGLVWEIDEFEGENTGLVVAEVELESEDQHISLPGWVGEEVTGDPRYYNSSLVANPYLEWPP
jgi:CYTH domain-containing protein